MSESIDGPSSFSQSNPPPRTSTMAIVSLVVGILSWFILPLVGGIIAVFSGTVARKEIKSSGGQFTGDGMAVAGLVLGYTNIVVYALSFLCFLVVPTLILAAGLLNQ